ncbi:unnamed protein product [Rhizophagus irregularis]|nr:unnamed protein product [Rhizophagus irregularis]
MELIQKLGKWKYNDEYQLFIKSDNIVEKIIHIEDLEEKYMGIECNEPGTGNLVTLEGLRKDNTEFTN